MFFYLKRLGSQPGCSQCQFACDWLLEVPVLPSEAAEYVCPSASRTALLFPFSFSSHPSACHLRAAEHCWRHWPSHSDCCHDKCMVSGLSRGCSSAQQSLHHPQVAFSPLFEGLLQTFPILFKYSTHSGFLPTGQLAFCPTQSS